MKKPLFLTMFPYFLIVISGWFAFHGQTGIVAFLVLLLMIFVMAEFGKNSRPK